MKKIILLRIFVLAALAVASGCNKQASVSSQDELTAADMAQLMDLHAWTVIIPQSQPPFKAIRLLVRNHDGTIVTKFSTGDNFSSVPCMSVCLGFRIEHGSFKGQFNTRNAQGGGKGWKLDFADALANDRNVGWTINGTLLLSHDQEILAMSPFQNGEKWDSIMAIELVK